MPNPATWRNSRPAGGSSLASRPALKSHLGPRRVGRGAKRQRFLYCSTASGSCTDFRWTWFRARNYAQLPRSRDGVLMIVDLGSSDTSDAVQEREVCSTFDMALAGWRDWRERSITARPIAGIVQLCLSCPPAVRLLHYKRIVIARMCAADFALFHTRVVSECLREAVLYRRWCD